MKFKDWFDSRLVTSPFPFPADFTNPKSSVFGAHVVINVADEFIPEYAQIVTAANKEYYWLPMGENGKGLCLENLIAACIIILHYMETMKTVVVHCQAGKNRSVTVADAIYFICTGGHRPENYTTRYRVIGNNRLIENCSNDFLPGISKMEKILIAIKVIHIEQHGLPIRNIFDKLKHVL